MVVINNYYHRQDDLLFKPTKNRVKNGKKELKSSTNKILYVIFLYYFSRGYRSRPAIPSNAE